MTSYLGKSRGGFGDRGRRRKERIEGVAADNPVELGGRQLGPCDRLGSTGCEGLHGRHG